MTSTPDAPRGEPHDHDGILEMADVEDDEYTSAVLDEGYSPQERSVASAHYGLSAEEESAGSTLEQRLREEEPEPTGSGPDDGEVPADADDDGEMLDDEVGGPRAGRLMAPDQGTGEDREKSEVATDVGIDGGGASAEEAAVHVVPEEGDDRY